MGVEELLSRWLSVRRDVSFPVHADDSGNVDSGSSVFYGFTPDGVQFHDHWELHFTASARITACFTGVLYVSDDGGGEYSLLLYSFANRTGDLVHHKEYPLPGYARYRPFSDIEIEAIAENLLTLDRTALEPLVGPCAEDVMSGRVFNNRCRFRTLFQEGYPAEEEPDDPSSFIDLLKTFFVTGSLTTGIPVNATDVLAKLNREIEVYFHPLNADSSIDLSLTFNLNHYFKLWEPTINRYTSYPASFKQSVIAPPLTTGNIHYVRSPTTSTSLTPNYTTIEEAYDAAGENDTILILDNGLYSEPVFIHKFISIMGLHDADDDATDLQGISDSDSFVARATGRYPTITSGVRNERGVVIEYRGGDWGNRSGLVYLSNLAVLNNMLETDTYSHSVRNGGAGIYINGLVFEPDSTGEWIGRRFSNVHIHNCVIGGNRIIGSYVDAPFMGGGIMMNRSSAVISQSVISHNESTFVGGGIGINTYSWPLLIGNVIEFNWSKGNLNTTDNSQYGDNGDGGGIGIIVARPDTDRRERFASRFFTELHSILTADELRRTLIATWDFPDLDHAKSRKVYLKDNLIRYNHATLSGGGVYGTIGTGIRMINNTISYNLAEQQRGGGVSVSFGSHVVMDGDTVAGNVAYDKGGGIYFRSTKADLRDVEITENVLGTPTGSRIRAIPGGPGNKGGGLCLDDIQEVDGPTLAGEFDLILTIVFDHIDQVRLDLTNTRIVDNRSATANSLLAVKGEYNGAVRLILEVAGLIRLPPLHVVSDGSCVFVSDAHIEHPGGTATYSPGDDVTL